MRFILATVALGLGVNCPDVDRTIDYGCSETILSGKWQRRTIWAAVHYKSIVQWA